MIVPSAYHLTQLPVLNRPLTSLKGIGPKRAEDLAQKGLHTILDLLFFTPIRYEDRSKISPINKTGVGPPVLVRGKVLLGREERFFRSGKRLYRLTISDDTAVLDLLWFHYKKAHLMRFTKQGLELLAYGRILKNRGKRQMVHPDISLVHQDREIGGLGYYPVYSMIKGVSGQVLRSAIKQALGESQETLVDAIPREITRRLGMPELPQAVKGVHFPPRGSSFALLNKFKTRCHQRLIFDRFFRVMLGINARKRCRERREGLRFSIPKDLMQRIEKCFPFTLTGGQVRAIDEMVKDLSCGRPMNRLLQGDVGCGKTVVAAVIAYVATQNEWQVAVMVPTQVLARQHYEYFSSLSPMMGFRSVLLTGSIKSHERLEVYEKVGNAEYNLIIGTQALIHEDLSFAKLGLVVIDEQHRFGVRQRALLDQKGVNPHLLVMTATPIPRTLAMTVYADLDISLIKEYPEGHRPVTTRLIEEGKKRDVYNTVKQRICEGQQAMVICPVIEWSEEADLKNALEMYAKLRKVFAPPFRVGLIHGRLCQEKKDQVMDRFRKGHIDLLVGTTVIEVGVHAPRTTVMVVEHPERFGLAQLHQLRGRVGRGSEQGLCLLMHSKKSSEETLSRLKVLLESSDGFEIAQKDLEMRGQGELTGFRQSGAGELDFREMFREPELLMTAKREAESVLDSDPELSLPENRMLRDMVQSILKMPLNS